jgi:hypothetical protein
LKTKTYKSKTARNALFPWFASLILLGAVAYPTSPRSTHAFSSSSIVISEFRTRGPNGGNDEFIELYNLSSSSVNIGGWRIEGSNNSGSVTTRAVVNGTVVNPHCHYLLANSNPQFGPYSGSVIPDQTYGVGITDDGGIALTMPDGTIVDQVGLSSGSAFREGSTLSPLISNSDRGYERRPGGASGSGQDSDNNQSDFRLILPSGPQGAAAMCSSDGGGGNPTPPVGIGNAEPSAPVQFGSVLLCVRVTLGSSPTSTGVTVGGDLSPLNGSPAQQFFDDGTHGDVDSSDDIYSYRVALGEVPLGPKSLMLIVGDAQSRTSTLVISLEVFALDRCGVERWPIKTGTDVGAVAVSLSSLMPTTIAAMTGWAAPASIPTSSRIVPYETTAWVLTATLTEYKLEEDSDYHLILRDEAGHTMIAEIPCPCCISLGSPFAAAIASAREQFNSRFDTTTTFQTANIPVRISGVGMFDFPHGQTGTAPNQIELHPVLSVAFDESLAKPAIVSAGINGKKLLVLGLNFGEGAKVYLDGEKQKTTNDDSTPTNLLIAKKAGKKIERGQVVVLTVRNPDGIESEPFSFRRPN